MSIDRNTINLVGVLTASSLPQLFQQRRGLRCPDRGWQQLLRNISDMLCMRFTHHPRTIDGELVRPYTKVMTITSPIPKNSKHQYAAVAEWNRGCALVCQNRYRQFSNKRF